MHWSEESKQVYEDFRRRSQVFKASEKVCMLGDIMGMHFNPDEVYRKCKMWTDEELSMLNDPIIFTRKFEEML